MSDGPLRQAVNNPTFWISILTLVAGAVLGATRKVLISLLPWTRREEQAREERSDAEAESKRIHTRIDAGKALDEYIDRRREWVEERERLFKEIDVHVGEKLTLTHEINREKAAHLLTTGLLQTALRCIVANGITIPPVLQDVEL